jgi:hypothetical protein
VLGRFEHLEVLSLAAYDIGATLERVAKLPHLIALDVSRPTSPTAARRCRTCCGSRSSTCRRPGSPTRPSPRSRCCRRARALPRGVGDRRGRDPVAARRHARADRSVNTPTSDVEASGSGSRPGWSRSGGGDQGRRRDRDPARDPARAARARPVEDQGRQEAPARSLRSRRSSCSIWPRPASTTPRSRRCSRCRPCACSGSTGPRSAIAA